MAGHDGQRSIRASSQGSKARPGNRRVAQWTRDYVRLPGIPDEFVAPDGAPRAVWTRFFDAFATLAPAEIERRFGSADRHLREAGVTYRAPGELDDIRSNKDCLKKFAHTVTQAEVITRAELDAIDRDVAELIERAVQEAKDAPQPSAADLLTDVYVSY